MRLTSLLHSTVFRLAGAYILLVALAFFIVGALAYWFVTEELQSRLDRRIVHEHSALTSVLQSEGRAALTIEIERRAGLADNGDRVYLLVTPEGARLAGNVEAMECKNGWMTLEDSAISFLRPQSDDPDIFYVYGTSFDQACLLTGRSNEDVEETQEIVLESLGWGLLSVFVAGVLGAVAVGVKAQKRMHQIEAVLAGVSRGDLSQRIPVSGGGDLNRIALSINQTLARLDRAVDSLKQVTTDIAHELKTPINRLRHKLENAEHNARSEAEYKVAIEAAVSESDSIISTFEAMLRIAAIEAGARRARFQTVDLRKCVETATEIYAPVAHDAGHALTSDISSAVNTKVSGDEELLMQMLVNVIENSIRHCPAGSNVKLTLDEDEGALAVTVHDDGPGIPQSEHDRVFDRMYRVDKSRSTRGNGLGLSLVAAIADLHGAVIKLESQSPGLRVIVRFPGQVRMLEAAT